MLHAASPSVLIVDLKAKPILDMSVLQLKTHSWPMPADWAKGLFHSGIDAHAWPGAQALGS